MFMEIETFNLDNILKIRVFHGFLTSYSYNTKVMALFQEKLLYK